METTTRVEPASWLSSVEGRRRVPPERLAAVVTEGRPQRILVLGPEADYFALSFLRALPAAELFVHGLAENRVRELNAEAADMGASGRLRPIPRSGLPDLEVDSDAMDAVALCGGWSQAPRPKDAVLEIGRVLRAGGKAVLVDWDPDAPGREGPPREQRKPVTRVQELLGDAGFEGIERLDLFEDFWALRATAPQAP